MRTRDNPEILVKDGDISRAIKALAMRSGAYGTRNILKMRRQNPGRSARKKAKANKSLKRYMRAKERGKVK
jgi:hypothetical protein